MQFYIDVDPCRYVMVQHLAELARMHPFALIASCQTSLAARLLPRSEHL